MQTVTPFPTGTTDMASDDKLYQTILAGLLDWIWGKGQPDIQRQLQQASQDTLPTAIGHIVFALVQEGSEQAHDAGHDPSMDVLLGVATELIESLEKMAAALGFQFDAQAVSMQALTTALTDYAHSLPDGSAAQKDAQDALRQLDPGDVRQAGQTLQQIGAQNGVDPFAQQQQQGQGMPAAAAPTGPAAAGAQPQGQGLMGAAQ